MQYINLLECGGILVSDRFALTAGHCVYKKNIENFVIRAGTSTLGEGGQTFTISQAIFHPKFDISQDHYDAVLLLLDEPVSISNVKFAVLATDDSAITEGATIMVAGWGWIESNNDNEYPPTLRDTSLVILGDKECKNSYKTPVINDEMFCANYSGTEIHDFCFGDYGGPGVINGILQGIISFGEGCGDGYNGKVFVRVSKIREWIQSIIY